MDNLFKYKENENLNLIGCNIYFRLVNELDAEFIYKLRINERYTKYLSKVDSALESQIEWIKKYKERELKREEFYYIIHRIDNNYPIGTVRIYDFIDNKNSFCWGSWILNEDKTRYAALECAILIYDFAFFKLGFEQCHMDIRKQNKKVIEFHNRFGVNIIGETEIDFLGIYHKNDYVEYRKVLTDFLSKKGINIDNV